MGLLPIKPAEVLFSYTGPDTSHPTSKNAKLRQPDGVPFSLTTKPTSLRSALPSRFNSESTALLPMTYS